MNTEQWMREYLKENKKDPLLQHGAVQMYEATKEEGFLNYLKAVGNEAEAANGCVLSFLYQITNEPYYLNLIEKAKDGFERENRVVTLPFYMEYETKYGKKERYNEIIRRLEQEQERVYDANAGKLRVSVDEAILQMMVCVDTMSAMSIEIYELYRKLQDFYKQLLKCVLKEDTITAEQAWMLSYTMFKACRMRIILQEKYMDTAEGLLGEDLPQMDVEEKAAGIYMMAYAQKQMLERERM